MEPTEKHYEQAYSESQEDRMKPGVYAKCLAAQLGDEAKAKAQYIEERAKQLADEQEARRQEALIEEQEQARIAAEEEARRIEEEVKKADAERLEKLRTEKENAERIAQQAKEEQERKRAAIKRDIEALASDHEKWTEEARRFKEETVAARDKLRLIVRKLESSNDEISLLELEKQNLIHTNYITTKERDILAGKCKVAYCCSLVMSIICSASLLAALASLFIFNESDLAVSIAAFAVLGYPLTMVFGQSILDAFVGSRLKPHHIAIGQKLREELKVVGRNTFLPYQGHRKIKACYDECIASIPASTPKEQEKRTSQISQEIDNAGGRITKLQESLEEARIEYQSAKEVEETVIAKASKAKACAAELEAAKSAGRLIDESVLAENYQVSIEEEPEDPDDGIVYLPTIEEFKSQFDGDIPLKYYNDKQIVEMHSGHIENLRATSASKSKGSSDREVIRKSHAYLSEEQEGSPNQEASTPPKPSGASSGNDVRTRPLSGPPPIPKRSEYGISPKERREIWKKFWVCAVTAPISNVLMLLIIRQIDNVNLYVMILLAAIPPFLIWAWLAKQLESHKEHTGISYPATYYILAILSLIGLLGPLLMLVSFSTRVGKIPLAKVNN